jgi:uncharacterized secreted protein with C-terminal beta-propeller domain
MVWRGGAVRWMDRSTEKTIMRRYLVCLTLIAFVAGCEAMWNPFAPPDGDGEGIPGVIGEGESSLKLFQSEEEFQQYFSGQVEARNEQLAGVWFDRGAAEDDGAADTTDALAPAPEAPAFDAGGDGEVPITSTSPEEVSDNQGFSGTTLQEVGVDEADVVKTDGDYIYVISGEELNIVEVESGARMVNRGSVELEGHGRDIYLYGDTIVAITAQYGGFLLGPVVAEVDVVADEAAVAEPDDEEGTETGDESDVEPGFVPSPDDNQMVYERPKVIVTVIDVSDRDDPRVTSVTRLEGSQALSRMVDGVLHLVIPNYPEYYFDVFPMLGRPELVVGDVEPELFLPGYERIDADGSRSEGELITWESLYRPEEPGGFGVITVVSMDIENDAEFTSVGIVAEPQHIYSSREALYITNARYIISPGEEQVTQVYKFRYENRGVRPVAAGSVPGHVLNQYSMGEYQGYLRVATTTMPVFFFAERTEEPVNAVYVLGEQEGALTIVGSVKNIAPRETIQSARFIGDRGYVVTFEQIDPLFTLDLSNPTDPRIIGELKVPGFSTFIVPMDRDHLLTVGQYVPVDGLRWNTAIQLSIFDVSDFANPEQVHHLIIGEESGSWSDALWDPKAFTYYAERGLVAMPISVYDNRWWDVPLEEDLDFEDGDGGQSEGEAVAGSGGEAGAAVDGVDGGEVDADAEQPAEPEPDVPWVDNSFDGLIVFEVSTGTGFNEIGRISTRMQEGAQWYWPSFTRGVFIGEDVYAVTNHVIRGAELSDMSATVTEAVIVSPVNDRPEPLPVEPGPAPSVPTDSPDNDGDLVGSGADVGDPEVAPADDGG